jgi:hypothetical protein
MTLENEVMDSLEDLDYPEMEVIRKNGLDVKELSTFSSIVSWISIELQRIANFESHINPIQSNYKLFELN